MEPAILLFLPPSWVMVIGALSALLCYRQLLIRNILLLVTPLLTLAQIGYVSYYKASQTWNIAGFTLEILSIHPYSVMFATVFCIAAFAGMLFAYKQSKLPELVAALLYAAGAIGVTFSGDLMSLFLYWELMAVASIAIMMCSKKPKAPDATLRYAYIHLLGGSILMAGIAGYALLYGDISLSHVAAQSAKMVDFYQIGEPHHLTLSLILIGVLINVAAFPFSAWLPDAYPESSPQGNVFLSAFTTKTAIYVLLTLFAGYTLLIWVGAIMILYSMIMAIRETHLRRMLAYSIINQVGLMVVGIGVGTSLALQGVAIHAFSHIIYKALLFMTAGSVIYVTGKEYYQELGGLYSHMKLTSICAVIGALSISAFPLTFGFISKSIIFSAVEKETLDLLWGFLVAASVITCFYAGFKYLWMVFFRKNSKIIIKNVTLPLSMKLAMILLATLCIIPAIPGVVPLLLYPMLGNIEYHNPYTVMHMIEKLIIGLGAGGIFWLCLPRLKSKRREHLDIDWIYRRILPLGLELTKILSRPLREKGKKINLILVAYYQRQVQMIANGKIMLYGRSIGNTSFSIVLMLGIYLFIYYWT